MKFTQLFNWFRFRLLTPFQNMRNRFFLERDSKHRRVLVNFGFTFRNSKWSSFAQTNLSSKIPSSFKLNNVVFFVVVMFVITCTLSYGFTYSTGVNVIFGGEVFYSFVELIRTSTCYSIAVLCTCVSAFSNYLWTRFLNTVFSIKAESNSRITETVTSANELSQFPHAIQLKSIQTGSTSSAVEAMFKPADSSDLSIPVGGLYRVSDMTQSTVPTVRNLSLKYNELTLFNPHQLESNKWSFVRLQSEQLDSKTTNNSLLHNLTDESFSAVNNAITSTTEGQKLVTLHTNYLQNIKIDRWLYRYSLLHRRSLHKGHNLTLAKRLTSLGFFSGNLTASNMWAANFVRMTPDLQPTLTGLYKQTYGNIWQTTDSNTPLSDIEFFESSYFWVLKRFYNLNTLDRNCVVSTINPNKLTTTSLSTDVRVQASVELLDRMNLDTLTLFSSFPNHLIVDTGSTATSTFTDDVHTRGLEDINSTKIVSHVMTGDVAFITRALLNDKVTPSTHYLYFNSNNYQPTTFTNLKVVDKAVFNA